MIRNRPWLPLLLAGCSWAQCSLAQNEAPGGGGSPGAAPTGGATTGGTQSPGTATGTNSGATGTTTGGTGATGTNGANGTTGGTTGPGSLYTPPPETGLKVDPFGFGSPSTTTGGGGILGPEKPAATTNFGMGLPRAGANEMTTGGSQGAAAARPKEEPITYSASGFYGRTGQTLTAGQGRLARPRYRYSASLGMGFDSNTLQTPDNSGGTPDQIVRQEVPEQPEISTTVPRTTVVGSYFFAGKFHPITKTVNEKVVLRPFQPAQVIEQVIPGVPPREKNSSVVTNFDVSFDMQWARPRTLFTLDLGAGGSYYWNRPDQAVEYNGRMSLVYLRRLTGRTQFTANASIAYTSQPDYSNVTLGTTQGGSTGNYVVANTKFDLNHRWTGRFSTATSFSFNAVKYEDELRKGSDYTDFTLGNEFRYRSDARTTWVAELRYSTTFYPERDGENSNTIFLLLGADWKFSRRLSGTLRVGESVRTYEAGGDQSSPYLEIASSYLVDARNQFQFTGRYGFENSNVNEQSVAARIGLSYLRTFTPRLSGNASVNYINNKISTDVVGANSVERKEQTIDSNLGLNYRLNRHWSLSSQLTYTLLTTSQGLSDYDRSRFFLTGRYEF